MARNPIKWIADPRLRREVKNAINLQIQLWKNLRRIEKIMRGSFDDLADRAGKPRSSCELDRGSPRGRSRG